MSKTRNKFQRNYVTHKETIPLKYILEHQTLAESSNQIIYYLCFTKAFCNRNRLGYRTSNIYVT